MFKLLVFIIFCANVFEIMGHGMMLEPPNRSSLWRFNLSNKTNYQDNQNFCGGFGIQWGRMANGKCGVCGDKWDDPHPQENENTGYYGEGKVVRTYKVGGVVPVTVQLTANHLGYFKYSVCKLDDPTKPESGEACFKNLNFENGESQYNVNKYDFNVNNKIQLPSNFTCERCTFRWTYTAGNNWGVCDDGSQRVGCGPQETFRSCADITIST